ncbi:MAG: HisS family protein [Chloroflexota bacterium]
MTFSAFTRPPGFYDRVSSEAAEAAETTLTLQQTMTRFGYQIVETPLVEYADLLLTKAGDDAVNRLFNFEMHGRQLCLRPEFTASAARLYVERYQHEPKPIRWQFAGPVFRYESPQRSHSRQFTMLGAELIGPSGVGGDAEAMGMAARGLYAVDLHEWTLVVGHVGLITQLLDRFDLDRRMRRVMLGHIENLRRPDRGRAYVEAQLIRLYAGLPQWFEQEPAAQNDLTRSLQLIMESANLGTTGRSSEDIARRLANKQRQANKQDEIIRALDMLEALVAIKGPPAQAFAALDALLPDHKAIQQTAQAFRATIELLPAYGVALDQVNIQMDMARGLNYYTGLVFEAHTTLGDSASQLFGGGRYDDFIRVLGASKATQAIGFAYGLERILQERRRHGYAAPSETIRVLVVTIDDADNAEAARVAMVLREHVNTELFIPPTRNLSQALARANKQGTPYVVIVGEAERNANQITLRDMHTGIQLTCDLTELIRQVGSKS